MPFVHDLRRRIRGRRVWSRFYTAGARARGAALAIPRYRQLDGHSCGFLAALAVVRYFAPRTPAAEVLNVWSPRGGGWVCKGL